MIIMSVDLGKARTGIAVCDKSEFLASPYTVIFEKSPKRLKEKVAQAAKDTGAELIVVGLPKNMDGTEGESAHNARAFAEELGGLNDKKTEYIARVLFVVPYLLFKIDRKLHR